jgi:hypothetical protein
MHADPTPMAADDSMKVFVLMVAASPCKKPLPRRSSAFIGVGSAGIGAFKAF